MVEGGGRLALQAFSSCQMKFETFAGSHLYSLIQKGTVRVAGQTIQQSHLDQLMARYW